MIKLLKTRFTTPYPPLLRGDFLLIAAMFFMLAGCQSLPEINFRGKLISPPPATRQLGPAVFLPAAILEKLQLEEGTSILVKSDSSVLELRAYLLLDSGRVLAIHKKYRKKLGLSPGIVQLTLSKIEAGRETLSPRPLRVYAENYSGDTNAWSRIAFGAPHGDCDMETGNIVKQMSETYGIPSTAGYGARLSYRGKWFDMNRPLMKLPKRGGGTLPDRVWNDRSQAVYRMYQDSVWKNSGLKFGERFDLFCSFHGHDLTVRLANGKRVERPVMEAMGIGFKKNELRKIKSFYERHKSEYYKAPPLLVFGNLPEDRTYYYQSIPMHFFYSGLGTRVYGSLRSDLVKHALHIETPNTMRLDPHVQPQTARFLYELFTFIKDSILSVSGSSRHLRPTVSEPAHFGDMVSVPAGSFLMGTEDKMVWSSERPQHRVQVSAFSIDRYEVSNARFAAFLNDAQEQGQIFLDRGIVKSTADTSRIILRTTANAPLSQIEYQNRGYSAIPGKEYFPVIYVSWHGAKMYASSLGKRLPTEAEWEKAASWSSRGKRKYLFAYRSNTIHASEANFEDSGDPFETGEQAFTTPLGWYKIQSPAGAYDMSGNVFEWCADYYDYNFYKKKNINLSDNPQGPEKGTMRTVRGGAWNLEPWISRTTFRLGIHPNSTLVNTGFRCVKDE